MTTDLEDFFSDSEDRLYSHYSRQQEQREKGKQEQLQQNQQQQQKQKQPLQQLLLLQQYFPRPFIARPLQVECLRRIEEEALRQGYRDIIICAPTGIGKSMIALTLANACCGKYRLLRVGGGGEEERKEEEEREEEYEGEETGGGADILTATTLLQDQYAREFRDIRTIMGRGNFLCLKYDIPAREVPTSECRKVVVEEEEREGEGEAVKEEKKRDKRRREKVAYCIYHPKHSGNCPYYKQKIEGLRSRIRVMNYHEYLTLLTRGELSSSNRDHSKRPRPLLIMDEAHAIEDIVVSFFTITIGRNKARRLGIVSTFDSIVNASNGGSNSTTSNGSNGSNSNSNSKTLLSLLALELLANYLRACEVEKDMLEKKKREIEEMIEEEIKKKRKEEEEEKGREGEAKEEELLARLRSEYIRYMRRLSAIENHMLKVDLVYRHMLENPEEYIVQVDKVRGTIRFIPLTARVFYSFISRHTTYRVYMSATISKELLLYKELGIPEEEGEGKGEKGGEEKKGEAYCYIDLPSPFPVENRRVYLLNIVKLSNEALRSNEKETMSKLVASITSIMDKHSNERGLILVPSYALADLIYSYLPKEYRSRLVLTRWRNGGDSSNSSREVEGERGGEEENKEEEGGEEVEKEEGVDKVIADIARKKEGKEKREEEVPEEAKKEEEGRGRERILAEHTSRKNSVLLSTNFWEGVDLRDDLCRFIIIPKVPYPDLSDLRNRTKLERGDRIWYELKAVMKIIQGSGRGVRHDKDYCTTYILDSNASWLFKKHMKELPRWFREALSWSNYTTITASSSSGSNSG